MDQESSILNNMSANVIIFGIALLLISVSSDARLYKWVDADGKIRYGDQLPNEFANKKHFQLDPQGRVIMTKEAGKSPQQLKKERALAKKEAEEQEFAKKEAEKQRIKQNRQDRILLLTFNSESDIFYARDQRLQVIDSKIKLLKKNKFISQAKLLKLNEQADKQFRFKKIEVAGGLQQKIEEMYKKVSNLDKSIIQLEYKRVEVKFDSEKDLERFQDLKARQRKNKK